MPWHLAFIEERRAVDTVAENKPFNEEALVEMAHTMGFDPVSYTHLDVYKRQLKGRLLTRYSPVRH